MMRIDGGRRREKKNNNYNNANIKINTCNNKMSHDDLVAELDKYESRRYHFTLHIGKLGRITSTLHCTVKRSQHWPFRFPSAMGWCKTVVKSNKRSM